MAIVGCARAFPQRQNFSISDRYIALPPPRIDLKGTAWNGSFFPDNLPGRRNTHGFLCKKPLYGPKCAPLIWCVTISSVIRAAGYYQHHLDMCVFSKRWAAGNSGSLCAVLIIHVGDILMCGSAKEIQFFPQTIQQFDTGEIVSLQLGGSLCSVVSLYHGSRVA